MERLLTLEEIADRLGVSVNTLRQWRYTRTYLEFPPPDLKGPKRHDSPYWYWSTIETWMNRHRPDLKR